MEFIGECMIDPRDIAIKRKLEKIEKVIAFLSGKGGVGKSIITALSGIILSRKKFNVGILDLDFHGPVIPTILGIEKYEYSESKSGLIPPNINGLKIMSLAFFTEDRSLPFRGTAKTSIFKEIMAITNWGKLNYLLVDMPPGTGDEILDFIKILGDRGNAILITTPSIVSQRVLERVIKLLVEIKFPIIGVIENMSYISMKEGKIELFGKTRTEDLAERYGLRLLGRLPFDMKLEMAQGSIGRLSETCLARQLSQIIYRVFNL